MKTSLLIALAALGLSACSRQIKPETLAGEWCQDIDYSQSTNILIQVAEISDFEDYELYFTRDQVAATCLVGKEPLEERVYWTSSYSVTDGESDSHTIRFKSHDGREIVAPVLFKDRHFIIRVGKRDLAFIKDRATNLRIKGYIKR